jgi:DNA-binding CsgD family transcriptional regulator
VDHRDAVVLGRQRVVDELLSLLAGAPRVVTLVGDAGLGKTTVWSRVLQQVEVDWRWSASCLRAECDLGLALIADFVAAVPEEVIARLPTPQHRAIDVLLYRTEPDSASPSVTARLIGVTTLSLLRELTRSHGRVLLAIDDLHWCDRASLDALRFALHRLTGEQVSLFANARSGQVPDLPGQTRIDLEPLGDDATRDLIRAVSATPLPRQAESVVVRTAGGNPFFARELALSLADGQDLAALPGSLRDAAIHRLGELSEGTAESLLDLAVRGEAGPDELPYAAMQDAFRRDVVRLTSGRVRFAHPLLARAVLDQSSPAQRRAAHARAARSASDPVARARHRAQSGATGLEFAHELDRAAQVAAARGDLEGARELAGLAATQDRTGKRLITTAGLCVDLGEFDAATESADEALSLSDDVVVRNQALRIKAWTREEFADAEQLLDIAATLPTLPDAVQLATRAQLGQLLLVAGRPLDAVRQLERALVHASQPSAAWASAAASLSVARREAGLPVDDDLLRRAVTVDRGSGCDKPSLAVSAAAILAYLDDRHGEARKLLDEAEQLAFQHGGIPITALYAAALACRTGELTEAARRVIAYLARAPGPDRALPLFRLAHIRAWQGQFEAAHRCLDEGVEAMHGGTARHDEWRLFAAGFLSLLRGDADRAWTDLAAAAECLEAAARREPSHPPVLPAAVEAAAAAGEVSTADRLLRRLEVDGAAVSSRWAEAAAARCRGCIAQARGELDAAIAHYLESADRFGGLGVVLEGARGELAAGAAMRRTGSRRRAREMLQHARDTFARCGASALLRDVEVELGRIGGRSRSQPDELTESELQIAELVATGMRNSEVANALHLSVKTVETHLGRAFRKLGAANRTELARLMRDRQS